MPVLMVDVDGVLVHGRPQDRLPFGTFLQRDLGVPFDELKHQFFEAHWAGIVTGKQPMRPILERVLSKIAPTVSVDALIRYWFEHDAHIDHVLVADLHRQRQRGVKIYLATNQEHERAKYLMESLDLQAFTDGVFYSASLGCRKPSPEFYRQITERLGEMPENIVFIDDMVENIESARAFGWRAYQWTSGTGLNAILSDAWHGES
ncbi:HAD-IA family hydrolase [Agrobacterium vitis]|uniref:HAD-IA family hydrolase n=1 Tax=Agrobacterium vitis TaxID=373 RepID=A0ABD6G505_AGRVI|nr:HAD family phosphatase [Agrobacterium vitis]MUO80423.1 HAD-IA family hydrolase [Agrobacterium vitis]MUO93959.1 HAD-IA family hydrolase [Agrobacterium vitis]MUP03790.1 HAD-IA family hydrolase [Agrobacterium vitis]MUZ83338.1 HAD-IA family hydrolase [Agrobacterium vitis]MVA13009.1 HAD-IA family hydrolase [Agrobacterium vitis]